jgi:hypothetical protein
MLLRFARRGGSALRNEQYGKEFRKVLKKILHTGLGAVIGLTMLLLQAGGVKAQSTAVPAAVFPEKKYEFSPVNEGITVTHDFSIENQGQAPLEIKKVQPD